MLEIWQFQPTFESELILSVPVEQIETARGKIEAMLSKDAVIAYARSLSIKTFSLLPRTSEPTKRPRLIEPQLTLTLWSAL
jgi:hypothetical protein